METARPLEILAIEPYYAGSHRAFIDGWIEHSRHNWTLLTLPGHHWKWRMRHSAMHMAGEVNRRVVERNQSSGNRWDAVFVTDMLSVAEFRGMVAPEVHGLPHVLYFHENQLTYPDTRNDPRDFHFGFTNFTSAVAADEVWFNSQFNLDSFVGQLQEIRSRWPDHVPNQQIDAIASDSIVQYPGIDLPEKFQDRSSRASFDPDKPLHIVWAARWEHDKQPGHLLAALRILKHSGIQFRVSVLGERFRTVPSCFAEIESEFSGQIVKFGYQPTREEYFSALSAADVFVSTAAHEFFGLSAAEAVAIGLHPMLPNRLAYPELLRIATEDTSPFLYDGSVEDLARRIGDLARDRTGLDHSPAQAFVARLSWVARAAEMDDALFALDGS